METVRGAVAGCAPFLVVTSGACAPSSPFRPSSWAFRFAMRAYIPSSVVALGQEISSSNFVWTSRQDPIGKRLFSFAKSGPFEFREPGFGCCDVPASELDCIGRAATSAGLGTFLYSSWNLRRAFAIAVTLCLHSASSPRSVVGRICRRTGSSSVGASSAAKASVRSGCG